MSHLPLDPLADDDLTIRGQIDTTSVPELMRSLLASRETGVLTFRDGEVTKSIYVKDGRVVSDERSGEPPRAARLLERLDQEAAA